MKINFGFFSAGYIDNSSKISHSLTQTAILKLVCTERAISFQVNKQIFIVVEVWYSEDNKKNLLLLLVRQYLFIDKRLFHLVGK